MSHVEGSTGRARPLDFAKSLDLEIGIAVERQPVSHPWAEDRWKPVSAFVGSAAVPKWSKMVENGGCVRYHAGVFPVTLYRSDTDAYVHNLASARPSLFVVMAQSDEDGLPGPYDVTLVTLSPYEAQDYLDSGEEIVESVPLSDDLIILMEDFCDTHHKEEAFRKRKRDRLRPEEHKFGKEPIFSELGVRPDDGEPT